MQGNFNEPPYSKTQNLSQKLPSQQKGLNIRAQYKGSTERTHSYWCGLWTEYNLFPVLSAPRGSLQFLRFSSRSDHI